jgi:hypothetical protein
MEAVYQKLPIIIRAFIWTASIFLFTFANIHLIFAMKYWTLSLQIKEIVFKQPADSGRLLLVSRAIFWTL